MTPRAVLRRRRVLGALVVTGALLAVAQAGATAHPKPQPKPIDLQILSFNDYHGHLQPPGGSDGTVVTGPGTTVTAGGVEYLTTHLRNLRQSLKLPLPRPRWPRLPSLRPRLSLRRQSPLPHSPNRSRLRLRRLLHLPSRRLPKPPPRRATRDDGDAEPDDGEGDGASRKP